MKSQNAIVLSIAEVEAPFACSACGWSGTGRVAAIGSASYPASGLLDDGENADRAAPRATDDARGVGARVIALAPCPRCGERDTRALWRVRAILLAGVALGGAVALAGAVATTRRGADLAAACVVIGIVIAVAITTPARRRLAAARRVQFGGQDR